MRSRVQSFLWVAPLLLLIILAALNYNLIGREVDISSIDEGGVDAKNQSSTSTFSADIGGKDILALHTLARPLFSPTRREFVPDTKPHTTVQAGLTHDANAASREAKPTIIFQGTRIFGDSRSAFVLLKDASEGSWVVTGAEIDGWIVSDIGTSTLVLAHGTETATYSLYPN